MGPSRSHPQEIIKEWGGLQSGNSSWDTGLLGFHKPFWTQKSLIVFLALHLGGGLWQGGGRAVSLWMSFPGDESGLPASHEERPKGMKEKF